MKLPISQYEASKQFLLDYEKLKIINKLYQVNRGVYASIPTTTGAVKFRANDLFKFQFKQDKIISFDYNGNTYIPIWTQIKLHEWLDVKLRQIKSI